MKNPLLILIISTTIALLGQNRIDKIEFSMYGQSTLMDFELIIYPNNLAVFNARSNT